MEDIELLSQNNESDQGDSGELPCVGKRREKITKKKFETKCWCSKSGLALNAKHIVSCCKKVSGEINTMQDTSLTSSSTTSLSRGD